MYNGIGLTTPRGSGTNGYIQRNLSSIPTQRNKIEYKTEEELQKLDSIISKPPNADILEHQRKRLIENKVLEYQDELEERGYSGERMAAKLDRYRKRLAKKIDDGRRKKEQTFYEFLKDRKVPKDTHQYQQMNQEKNDLVKNAFGISKYFKEGSSLDPARKAKEELAKSEDLGKKARKYDLVRTPSPERDEDEQVIEKALETAKKRSKY